MGVDDFKLHLLQENDNFSFGLVSPHDECYHEYTSVKLYAPGLYNLKFTNPAIVLNSSIKNELSTQLFFLLHTLQFQVYADFPFDLGGRLVCFGTHSKLKSRNLTQIVKTFCELYNKGQKHKIQQALLRLHLTVLKIIGDNFPTVSSNFMGKAIRILNIKSPETLVAPETYNLVHLAPLFILVYHPSGTSLDNYEEHDVEIKYCYDADRISVKAIEVDKCYSNLIYMLNVHTKNSSGSVARPTRQKR